jgi:diguanylate cyclase (GGDEF)-like protein
MAPMALVIVHLDDFDQLVARGSQTLGDSVLVRLAERLENAVRQGDTVARWGPQEFAIALEHVRDEAEAERLAEQIGRAVSASLWVSGRDVRLQASVGTVLVREGLQSALSLLRQVEVARELAQRQGPGQRVLFDALGQSEWGTRPPFETLLREALGRGGVQVYFQPIVGLPARQVTGFEALLRWQDPTLGTMLPAEIVALAEESGLVSELDAFVLREACTTLKALRAQRGGDSPLYVAVNVSSRELEDGALAPLVRNALEAAGLPGTALAIEVREAALMNETLDASTCLNALRALGVRVHMDDFGTGYSSLSYLHRVALDALKVDASCVRELREGDDEIVRTAVTLGRALRMRVIAEGVETEAELAAVTRLGCAEAQGLLFGAPLPKAELQAFLRQHEGSSEDMGSRA